MTQRVTLGVTVRVTPRPYGGRMTRLWALVRRLNPERISWFGAGVSAAALGVVGYQLAAASILVGPLPGPQPAQTRTLFSLTSGTLSPSRAEDGGAAGEAPIAASRTPSTERASPTERLGAAALTTTRTAGPPRPTATDRPTATPWPTATERSTRTARPTSTERATPTPWPTRTPRPTSTEHPTPTAWPTRTPRPTPTAWPTATPWPTRTPRPTATERPTATPRPSATPATPLDTGDVLATVAAQDPAGLTAAVATFVSRTADALQSLATPEAR